MPKLSMPRLFRSKRSLLTVALSLAALGAFASTDISRADLLPNPPSCPDCQLPSCGDKVPCDPCDPQNPPVEDERAVPSPCGGPDRPIVEPEQPQPETPQPDKTHPGQSE